MWTLNKCALAAAIGRIFLFGVFFFCFFFFALFLEHIVFRQLLCCMSSVGINQLSYFKNSHTFYHRAAGCSRFL